jgi:hypothetical protein
MYVTEINVPNVVAVGSKLLCRYSRYFLQWNVEDPVSSRNKQNTILEGVQKPKSFIDNPFLQQFGEDLKHKIDLMELLY